MNPHPFLPAGLRATLALLLALALLSPAPSIARSVEGQLRPVSDPAPRSGVPVIYRHYQEVTLAADYARPRRASAIDLACCGPHARITGTSVFIAARERRVFDRIRVRLQFWGRHSGAFNAVFEEAPAGGQVDINLVGPFILDAGRHYEVSADFPEAIQLDAYQGVGVTALVLANANGGPIVEQDGLAISYTFGSGGGNAIGSPLAHYEGTATGSGEFNFEGSALTTRALALELRGVTTSHVQCAAWPQTANHLAEEFDGTDTNGIDARWSISQNGGDPVLRVPGQLTLSAGSSASFPYVRSRGAPIPASGEFSVRWLSRYTRTGPAGTGTLVVARGLPVNGSGDGSSQRLLDNWQHDTASPFYRIRAYTPGAVDVVTAGPGQHDLQDIEYCWLSDRIEVWVNGVRRLQVPNAGIPRPNALWSGNSDTAGAGSTWSHSEIYSVRVRKPFSDQIFGNGFD